MKCEAKLQMGPHMYMYFHIYIHTHTHTLVRIYLYISRQRHPYDVAAVLFAESYCYYLGFSGVEVSGAGWVSLIGGGKHEASRHQLIWGAEAVGRVLIMAPLHPAHSDDPRLYVCIPPYRCRRRRRGRRGERSRERKGESWELR